MDDDDGDYWHDCHINCDVEGFPPQPPSPKPAKSGPFSYNRNGLCAGGFSRAPLGHLNLLFRKNASSARRAAATKPWITAQLRLYDIAFNKSAKVGELRSTLEAAVKGRKCIEGGPPSIAIVQAQLAAQFAQNLDAYKQAIKEHKLDVNRWHKRQFSELGDPRAEACYDIDLFISKYFVDDAGLPAPSKTPQPVVLWEFRDESDALRRRVDGIPGLSAQITEFLSVIAWAPELERGLDTAFEMIDRRDVGVDHATVEAIFDPDRFLAKYFLTGLRGKPARWKREHSVVLEGWIYIRGGLDKLRQAAMHVPELSIRRSIKPLQNSCWGSSESCVVVGWADQEAFEEQSWKSEVARLEALEAQREARDKEKAILAKLKPHIDYTREYRSPPPSTFTPSHLVGSYIMHCRLLQDSYGCELGSMTLDIHAPTSTHGALGAFNFGIIEGTMLLATSEESLELLREEEAVRPSDDEAELADVEHFTASGKRRVASQQTSTKPFKRRLGSNHAPTPGRFYLQWAGCETGNAHLVLDDDHERTGYFDLDKSGTTARGQFHYRSFFGQDPLVFTLLKIADKPRKKPDAWSSYCEEERWIRW